VARLLFGPAVALALGSLIVARPSWGRPLASRIMVYLGKRSYGVYLVNLICLSFVVEVIHRLNLSLTFNAYDQVAGGWASSLLVLAAMTAVALVVAELLHRAVERPLIARGRIWSERITGRKPVAPPRMTPETEVQAPVPVAVDAAPLRAEVLTARPPR